MTSTLIRLDDCPPQPWKNGLGRTRELAVHPSGAGSEDFVWRVSVAEVDSAAPFSSFPGVDRYIALLEGAGFAMTLDGGTVHELKTPFEPFGFAGEAQVAVALAGGPTRDFNLMVRRSQARGGLDVCRAAGALAVTPSVALVFCAQGRIDTDTDAGVLHPGDAWRPAATGIGGATLHPESVALVVHMHRREG